MESSGSVPPLRRPKCVSGLVEMALPKVEENPRNSGPDELDPNTMEFSQLIDLMHPKFITDYLQRILNFLLDNTNELNFPNIAPFKRAFLERLVIDQNNLKCSRFDEHSKAVADRILEVLRSNIYKYKWTHSYENSSSNRGVLVYKKQYITNKNRTELKNPRSIPPNLLHCLTNTKTTKPCNNSVPTNFKIQWLNATLKFIKDDTQMKLDYPEMTLEMAEFIYSMINQPKLGLDNYGYKSMYAPLWEAMKIFSLKYDFKVIFNNTRDVGTTSLMLQKEPKIGVKLTANANGSRKVTSTRVRSPSPTMSSASSRSTSSLNRDSSPHIKRPQAYRKLQKLNVLINSLPPQYLTDCLNILLDFIINDSMASLILLSSSSSEEMFLCQILALAKAEEKHWILINPADRSVLKGINVGLSEAKAKGFWSMTLNWKVVNKQQRKKEAHFQKIPKFNNGNTKPPPSLDLKITEKEKINPPEESPRLKFLRALWVSIDNISDTSVNNDKEQTKNIEVMKSRDSSIDSLKHSKENSLKINTSTEKSSSITQDKISSAISVRSNSLERKSKNPISFQSAGQLDAVDQSINQLIDQPVASIDHLPKNKKKIFEAMTTPIDSDKGMRMMKLMGWSGGALGARGEGITEPIIPAIQIKTGAGLGHVPDPPKPKPKKDNKPEIHVKVKQPEQLQKKLTKAERTNFRVTFLKHLLEHIKGDSAEVKIEFKALSQNETKFMQIALLNFNNRRKVGGSSDSKRTLEPPDGLSTKEEVAYLQQIENELSDSQYVFNAEVDSISRSAIIKKSVQPIIITSHKNKQKKNKPKAEKEDPIIVLENSFTSHLDLLGHISKFLQSSDMETEFNFNKPKDRQRLDVIVAVANKKLPLALTTRNELLLYNEILDNMKDCCLSVKAVDELRLKYVVQKVYRRKFINSALSQPKNDKINNDDVNNNKSDGEDYLIIENDEEIDENTQNNYRDKSPENNNNIKKTLDIEYEKQMFQNEIDNIEKGDTVDQCIKAVDTQTNCEEITNIDEGIRDLENAMRNSNLDVTNTEDNVKEDADFNTNSTPTSKRSRTDSQSSDITLSNMKKNKNINYEKLLCIVPTNYPTDEITLEKAKQVQFVIANKIDTTVFLPLLKCLGIQNGTLLYGCHNQQSTTWLQYLVDNSNLDIQTMSCDIYEVDKGHALDIKINTFIEKDVYHLFLNLEVFNIGLFTNDWRVLNKIVKDDCMIVTVKVDYDSYRFIREHDFELYAGFDKALFRLHW